MRIHQHNSNGREWLMVEVPSEAWEVVIRDQFGLVYVIDNPDMCNSTYSFVEKTVALPSGTWRIHSDSFTITEEQAGEIVNPIGVMYEDYEYPEDLFMTATLSYRSLLRSLNINSRVINLVRI